MAKAFLLKNTYFKKNSWGPGSLTKKSFLGKTLLLNPPSNLYNFKKILGALFMAKQKVGGGKVSGKRALGGIFGAFCPNQEKIYFQLFL